MRWYNMSHISSTESPSHPHTSISHTQWHRVAHASLHDRANLRQWLLVERQPSCLEGAVVVDNDKTGLVSSDCRYTRSVYVQSLYQE